MSTLRYPCHYSGIVAGPEGSQKVPQGSPDYGSEGSPKFGLIVDDVGSHFNSENAAENKPEIVEKDVKNVQCFPLCFNFLPTRSVSAIRKIIRNVNEYK